MAQKKDNWISPEEYLERERKADFKSEYIDGWIISMSGASRNHNLIAGNLFAFLHNLFREKPCSVYMSDMKVMAKDASHYTYPDIVVVCGKEEYADSKEDILVNPICIIEVLSDSTEAYDRGDKFTYYQKIPSLKEYILVSQKRRLIETFVKQEDRHWLYSLTEEENLYLETADATIPLHEIYEKV
ncbi:MAG: Uma2 family endonuclease [Leptospiraceae bacterium]|nr:Uma2 family endonuclease [Leptospiraceae bacterium]